MQAKGFVVSALLFLASSFLPESAFVQAMPLEETKEITLTDESCERKVSVGIPQVTYMASLSCEEGTILIKSVAYGSGTNWNARMEEIGKLCNYQTQCKVAAKDEVRDDPFNRVYNRLIIVYECETMMTTATSSTLSTMTYPPP